MSKGKVLLVLFKGGQHAIEQKKLLGCAENELGIRKFVEENGYELVTTTDKDGPDSLVEKEIEEAEIVITTPFFPAYITRERIEKAKNLKLCITAGVGSDHIDLNAANEKKLTVAEVTGSNVVSVAEHALMTILNLVRNYPSAHEIALKGEWDIAAAARDEYDIEGKVVGTVGAGRIGYRILERLVAFNPKKLYYFDYQELPQSAVDKINQASKLFNGVDNLLERVESLEDMVSKCDVVTINCPLHEKTKGLFDKKLISHMKDGAWLVNTARGAICNAEDVNEAVKSGKLLGYGGDVWYPQPPGPNHPWLDLTRPNGFSGNAMTQHISGCSLDSELRYSLGTKSILESYFTKKFDYRPQDLIVIDGDYATKAYGERNKK
ncbi:formate dehydrogenase 1 [[Candida] jaroonii]|uniref:Formate dehydrogenase 1 n=1 Tax=[Candida] jaroonii TaxID=467808 RepID=A0ACA9Y6Y3_9ASCO|nr:formate dehydrogenase 1 [[Candida] jaroonii]